MNSAAFPFIYSYIFLHSLKFHVLFKTCYFQTYYIFSISRFKSKYHQDFWYHLRKKKLLTFTINNLETSGLVRKYILLHMLYLSELSSSSWSGFFKYHQYFKNLINIFQFLCFKKRLWKTNTFFLFFHSLFLF